MGFDFGTASTKVVLRTPNYLGGRAVAVPFDGLAPGEHPYLLPSRVVQQANGAWALGMASNTGDQMFANIKGILMGLRTRPADHHPVELSAIFFALALRQVRAWFLEHERGVYGTRRLKWSMNVGLPAAPHDHKDIVERFRTAAQAGWEASVRPEPVTPELVRKVLAGRKSADEVTDFSHVDLVPEVVAEVVGYARSDRRRDGLHFLVDVGATTLDACGFVLHQRGEDRYAILSADVGHHGTVFLQKARLEALLAHAEQADPLAPVPENLVQALAADPMTSRAVDQGEAAFVSKAKGMVTRIMWHVRKSRDHNAPCWKNGVPVFLCGGGRYVPTFDRLLGSVDYYLRQQIPGCPGIKRLEVLPPESLELRVPNTEYHRLAVAWGLSYDSFDIGEVSRPSEIEDFNGARRVREAGPSIDKEQV